MVKVSENEKRTVNGGYYYFWRNKSCAVYSTSLLKITAHKAFCSLCSGCKLGGSYTMGLVRSYNKSYKI